MPASIAGVRRPYSVFATPDTAVLSTSSQAGYDEDEDPVERRKRTEAVLFLAKTPLTTRKLAQMAHLADGTEARTMVRELNEMYEQLGRALRIEQIAGGYRMLTREHLAPWLSKLGYLPPLVRLSAPMMETLAVVGYRQPVSRANIEAVRGVSCGELLRQLMERDLIRIAGRSEELGRPYLYGTTKRFLQLFGLPNIAALPPIQWDALQEEHPQLEPPPDLLTPMKESSVSTAVAASAIATIDDVTPDTNAPVVMDPNSAESQEPAAIIEDEENQDLEQDYDDWDDDYDEDDDDFEEDDDWDGEDEDEDEDADWDGDEDDEWEEVDDEDDDEEDDLGEEYDEEDEDWDEDEGDEEDWDEEGDEEEWD